MPAISERYTALFEWLKASVPRKLTLLHLSTPQIIPFYKSQKSIFTTLHNHINL